MESTHLPNDDHATNQRHPSTPVRGSRRMHRPERRIGLIVNPLGDFSEQLGAHFG